MASSSQPPPPPAASTSATPTPAPSSPPPSESFLSDIDGTAPSLLDAGEVQWDAGTSGSGLNLVSWKRGVEEREEGVEKRGFYAISTVLNHPTRKANPLRSTRKPLPPIQNPPPLPKHPPPQHYDAYLKSVTPLYESFLQAEAGPSNTTVEQPRPTDLPPLDSVPDLFFQTDFDLAKSAIWARVVEAGPSNHQSSTVQNDLSSHLDILERHLIHEITLRSTSFFSALSNLQDLHSESTSCLERIGELQLGLREVGAKQARKGLEILEKMEDLRVLRLTEQGMDQLRELEEVLAAAKTLVEGGDWAGSLGCLQSIVRWWELHRPLPPDEDGPNDEDDSGPVRLPLSALPALAGLPQAVQDLATQIALQLEAALQSYLLSAVSMAELPQPHDEEKFEQHVKPIVEGLMRCGAGDAVEGIWREVTTLGVREGSRKHLPIAQIEDDAEDTAAVAEMRGASLASALKAMDHSRYLLLTAQMYASMLSRLRLSQSIGAHLSRILSTATTNVTAPLRLDPTSGNTKASELRIDEADIIASACELANLRASKILAVRGEQHAGLGISEFVELFKENWEFVLATETLAQRMIVSLRGVTASQARMFLIAYHSQRLTKSAKLVEEEQWSQIDVSAAMQHSVDIIIESAVSDPPECFIPPRQPTANGHTANGNGEEGGKTLAIEDKRFFVVKATGESLVLLKDYLGVVLNLEVVVTDVMGRIIEFLKSFNSRTCQVVLGAGAMRSAGLKHISAKHLALASQSLSVVVALIPYIREFIRRHLGTKQAVMLTEFDKLRRDYQEHQNEIHAKLVAIMSDRLVVHVSSLREINWEVEKDSKAPNAYAELLAKETATLHKVLSKYLTAATVEAVMSEVLAAIVHRLSEEYGKIELKSDEGKKRMSQDAALLSSRLTPLSEAGKTVSSLETLVSDKPVPKKNLIGNLLKRGKKGAAVDAEGGPEDGSEVVENGAEDEAGDDEDGPAVAAERNSMETAGSAKGEPVSKEQPNGQPASATEVADNKESSDSTRKSEESGPMEGERQADGDGRPGTSLTSGTAATDDARASSPAPPPLPDKSGTGSTTSSPRASTAALPVRPTSPLASTVETIPPPPSKSPVPPSDAKSPPPTSKSPLPVTGVDAKLSPRASTFSPPPISTPTPQRGPRLSLANRLKGVMNRAGSLEPRDTPPSPTGSPVRDDVVRKSLDAMPSPAVVVTPAKAGSADTLPLHASPRPASLAATAGEGASVERGLGRMEILDPQELFTDSPAVMHLEKMASAEAVPDPQLADKPDDEEEAEPSDSGGPVIDEASSSSAATGKNGPPEGGGAVDTSNSVTSATS